MSWGVKDEIENLRKSRSSLLKHIDGLSAEQTVWKPYPECKSVAETLEHLLWSDRATVESMRSRQEPDYSTVPSTPPDRSADELKVELAESHAALLAYLSEKYGDEPLDKAAYCYGRDQPLGYMLGLLIGEEGYHTGQVSFIRMAVDPSWDYYTAVYS